ncbi:MAG TPA: chemotaxis protein CheD [Bacillota bacterium]|jgi:chemotaxis protein CheD
MPERIVAIGLGEFSISSDPDTVLVGYGLGSCIGVVMYDPEARTGGMAHVVLPEKLGNGGDDAGAKCADSGVDRLLTELERAGCKRSRLVVKLAGGAQLLSLPLNGHHWDIGERNIVAVNEALRRSGLATVKADVGGGYGRTMRFSIGSGRVTVSTVGRGEQVL